MFHPIYTFEKKTVYTPQNKNMLHHLKKDGLVSSKGLQGCHFGQVPCGNFGRVHSDNLKQQWKIHHLKMYFLFKIGIFHCYVSLPECSFYPPCYPHSADQVATRVLHDWDLPRRGCPETRWKIIFGSGRNSPGNSEDMWVFPKIGVLQNGW